MTGEELYHWWFEKFGACGCGNPSESIALVRDVLALVDNLSEVEFRGPIGSPAPSPEKSYDAWSARERVLLPNSGIRSLVYYWFNHLDLMEHGGAVPGWLTKQGHEVLDALRLGGTDTDEWHSVGRPQDVPTTGCGTPDILSNDPEDDPRVKEGSDGTGNST